MKIIIDNNSKWETTQVGDYLVHYIGLYKELLPLLKKISDLEGVPQKESIDCLLDKLPMPSAVIMESKQSIIAFTDHFRCYPLFYTTVNGGAISNSARKLAKIYSLHNWDILSANELMMAGYVTGADTLIQGLRQFQTGESMIVNKGDNRINVSRYYRYSPAPEEGKSDDDWVEELDIIMNGVTQRMIDRANGRLIMAPLSAGLDSRLLVCKLHEAGYSNLETFSYGPPGNWEARGAQTVAKRLNLLWRLIATSRKKARQMFWAPERKAYWNFSDGLSALPNFQEYYTISKLYSIGKLPKETIFINGQTGDFITGGHIPKILKEKNANVRTLLESITSKHYSLWKNLKTPERLEQVEEKILKLLDVSIDAKLTSGELMSLYERWECEERQAKWVIHGQRAYDFFGYDWQLPLWDIELVKFYQRVPIHLKLDQRLYHLWLEKWDYNNLFRDFNPTVWRWPRATLVVVPLAKVVEKILGKNAKQAWYEFFFYWGHTAEHYAPYSYKEYFDIRSDIRNSTALNGRAWAKENYLPVELIDVGQ
ncbi:hypothetical protein HOB87_01640 [Candidatus Woesearchaeota archaeon]|nr:hypothetical protein [Candidatus Woesearchaeota archaeon]